MACDDGYVAHAEPRESDEKLDCSASERNVQCYPKFKNLSFGYV